MSKTSIKLRCYYKSFESSNLPKPLEFFLENLLAPGGGREAVLGPDIGAELGAGGWGPGWGPGKTHVPW